MNVLNFKVIFMRDFVKIISLFLALILLLFSVSCGSENDKNNETQTSQKVYNTAFKTATTVKPNPTTSVTETTTGEVVFETLPTTKKRNGNRKVYEQINDMRKITSAQLLTQIYAGITLGDSFNSRGLGYGKSVREYETYFGNPVVSRMLIESYSKAGFNAVRIPVSWSDHFDENGNIDPNWLDRIAQVVDCVLDYGMYCIINSQNDQNWLTTNPKNFDETKEKFSSMWTQIANRFIDYNDHLIFEGSAELLKAENDKSEPSKTDLKNANILNQTFVDAVRLTGKNNKSRHLIVSTYGAFVSSGALNGFTTPVDTAKNRLIAKVNIYVPSSFCLDESKDNIWGSKEDKSYIESVFAMINLRFSELKLPAIIGEFGAVDKGNVTARAAYANCFASTAYNYYIVCFWNDNGKNMKLFDRYSYENLQPNIVNSIISAVK